MADFPNALAKKNTKTPPVEEHAVTLKALFLKEGLMILFLALGLYLFLAISSYSPLDPGWSRTGDDSNINNSVGRTGAWISDVLLLLFGYLAYLFPLLLAYRALVIFRHRKEARPFSWELIALRGAGVILTLLGAATLATMHFRHATPQFSRGLAGQWYCRVALPSFDLTGSTLIFLTMLILGITLATGLSWLALVDNTGKILSAGLGDCYRTLAALERRSA